MKKIVGICLVFVFLIMGCSKEKRYENRIEGEWTLSNFAFNNADVLNNFEFISNHDFIIELEFHSDGNFDTEITEFVNSQDFSSSVDFLTLYGTWEIDGDKLKMQHNSSTTEDYSPALTYLFLDAIEYDVEEYTFDEFTIIELDGETLTLEALVQGYEVDLVGTR